MRYILLTKVENPDVAGDFFDYKKTAFDIARVRQEGEAMDYSSMGKLLRLVETIESTKEGEYLKLHETDWELFKKKVEKHSWPWFNMMFLNFVKAVVEAPDTDPREVTPDAETENTGEAQAAGN